MKGFRYLVLSLILLTMLAAIEVVGIQLGAQVSASARLICTPSVSHELDIQWRVTGTSSAVQVTIVITGPDGKTQSFTDSRLQGSRKVNVNYPNGGTANVRMTVRAGNQVVTDTANVSLTSCPRIQVSFTAQAVCGTAFSHQGVINWLVTSARDASISIAVTGPDGKTQNLTDSRVQGSRTVNLNYAHGGIVTVRVTARTSTGIQVTETATAVLISCLRLQISATPKSVCTSRASHELEIGWLATGLPVGTRVTIDYVITGPDGKQQSGRETESITLNFQKFTILLNYSAGGLVQVQVTVRAESSTATGSARASLLPCDPPGKTVFVPPSFGPGGLAVPETPDFIVTDIEVSQGIQDLENKMPLIAQRWTIVRVYVKDLKGIGAGNVGARLQGEVSEVAYTFPNGGGGGTEQIALGLLNPSNQNGGKITVKPDGGQRRNLDDSFWFRIPSSWHNAAISSIPVGAKISSYKIKFTAEVNPNVPGSILENNKTNNTKSTTVTFYPAQTALIRAVPLHLHENWDRDKPTKIFACPGLFFSAEGEDFWEIVRNTLRYHPIAQFLITCPSEPLLPVGHDGMLLIDPQGNAKIEPLEWDMSKGGGLSQTGHWGCLTVNQRLKWLKNAENLEGTWRYMGMVHPGLGGLCNGWSGAANSGTIWVQMSNSHGSQPNWWIAGGVTMAHEIGHGVLPNPDHVLCTGAEGPPNGSVDNGYPYPLPDCRMSASDEEGFYGLDVYYSLWDDTPQPTILHNHDPKVAFPFMGYQAPGYSDPYTYCGMMQFYYALAVCNRTIIEPSLESILSNRLKDAHAEQAESQFTPAQAQLRSARELVLVAGIVDVGAGFGRLNEVARQPANAIFPATLQEAEEKLRTLATAGPTSGFSLEVRDAQKRTLSSLKLISDVSGHGKLTAFAFVELLPFPEGAMSIALVNDRTGAVLDSRASTSGVPRILVVLPATSAATLKTGDVVRWEASDPDGDELTFNVLFSPDAGRTWQALALGMKGREYRLMNPLPGTARGLIRVVANDGFNTAQDDSDTLLSISQNAPRVTIFSPQASRTYSVNDPLMLYGIAEDLEESMKGENSLLSYLWSSDVNGVLGKTQEIILAPNTLKLGRHRLTLTITDSAGMSGQTTVEITIQPEVERSSLTIVTLTAHVKPACRDAQFSHEFTVSWEVTGGKLPVKVMLMLLGPDGTTGKIENRPLKGEQPLRLAYPRGGQLKIEIIAEDVAGARISKETLVTLDPCP